MQQDIFTSESVTSGHPDKLCDAQALVLPGIGKFGHAMKLLHDGDWISHLEQKVLHDKVPILGICLGMQLMTERSEESPDVPGLGWIKGVTRRFHVDEKFRVPHMGWNQVTPRNNATLLGSSSEENRFYFVHSYHVELNDKKDIVGTTQHGQTFTSAFERENLYGLQPHPEKSHKFGMSVFRRFSALRA